MDEPDPLQAGVDFFNAGDFFQAHEVWEDLWRKTRGAARGYYQGLIHAAVGLYHLERGNRAGAGSQIRKAILRLEEGGESVRLFDTARLIAELRSALETRSARQVRIVPLK